MTEGRNNGQELMGLFGMGFRDYPIPDLSNSMVLIRHKVYTEY